MGWYEAVKDAISAADRLRDAELKQKLAAVQVECAKLAEENARLRQDLLEARQQLETREDMVFQKNAYWRRLADGKLEGPFCPKCLDGAKRAARMNEDQEVWFCHVCNRTVQKPGRGDLHRPDHAITDFDPFR